MKKTKFERKENNQKWVLFVILLSFVFFMKFTVTQATASESESESSYSQENIDALFAKEVQEWINGYNRRS